ncbi:MAG TPA: hypothetical protein VGB67_04120 [Fibrella sp.]
MAQEMKKAGIVLDNYKIGQFQEDLTKAGFKFEPAVPAMKDTSIIKVSFKQGDLKHLESIVRKANSRSSANKNLN